MERLNSRPARSRFFSFLELGVLEVSEVLPKSSQGISGEDFVGLDISIHGFHCSNLILTARKHYMKVNISYIFNEQAQF